MQTWHCSSVAEVLQQTQSDAHVGLTEETAELRLKTNGKNELIEQTRRSILALFIQQYKDFMVFILFIATFISAMLGEYVDALTIAAIMILNGVLGVIQEYRAEQSLASLKKMTAPTARVLREATLRMVPAATLVTGDLLQLQTGDRIPADARVLESRNLQIDESALTGESQAVNKHSEKLTERELALGDRINMLFMGTMVTRGTGLAVVVQTGMQTEMGQIAGLLQSAHTQPTPLQVKLAQLGKILILISIVLTVLVMLAGMWHGHPFERMILAGVSLAVAAIPEGLPAIVTIALALGVQRMIRKRAIVRKLPSVETLGSATVICSDKTGTLTENKMTVTDVWLDGRVHTLAELRSGHAGGPRSDRTHQMSLDQLLRISRLCNNASINEQQAIGDATELALLRMYQQFDSHADGDRVFELPFDSTRKKMSVLVESGARRDKQLLCKGAPEAVLADCSHVWMNGRVEKMSTSHRQSIMADAERMANRALRVLALAYRDEGEAANGPKGTNISKGTQEAKPELWERNLVFVGLTGIIDPPRADAAAAVATCRQAGIRTIMITGDHQATAEAIARQLGIVRGGERTVSGAELEQMSDRELQQALGKAAVFARVAPVHKLRIVRALQGRGQVVAMTGDGVNDAPAIKAADIGIAMGAGGTDVAKEASALVLADDRFATIVDAIKEGRNIYDNIRKFIRYLLASNVGEMMTMMLAMLSGMPLPLVPVQILLVNLVTDGLPAMALGVDQAEDDLMHRAPRPPRETIFARRLGWKIMSRGILIGICTLLAFIVTYQTTHHLVHAQTVAFATLVLAQLIHVFDCRSSHSIFHRNMFENKYLLGAVCSSLLVLLSVIYMEPLQPLFHTTSLAIRDWTLIAVLAAIPTFLFGFASLLRHRPDRPDRPQRSHADRAHA